MGRSKHGYAIIISVGTLLLTTPVTKSPDPPSEAPPETPISPN